MQLMQLFIQNNMKKLLIVIPCLLFIACHAPKEIIKEVPVEIVKTEYKDLWHFDSIYLKENVYIYQKGDTIFRDSTHIKYVEKQVHDTLITHDTVPKTITITEVVEKKVPQWWPVWIAAGLVFLYILLMKTKFVDIIKNFIKYIINIFK